MAKLQNYFKDFLPLKYGDFLDKFPFMTANQAVVASLLRLCCTTAEVSAVKTTFDRVLGKPEKVIVIKRTTLRTLYPDATGKLLEPKNEELLDVKKPTDGKIILDEQNTPGGILRKSLEKIGDMPQQKVFDMLDNRDNYIVADALVANLYMVAARGENIGAMNMLFDYLDGSVADVVRIDGLDTIEIESYDKQAPYEAKRGKDGVYYVEQEVVQ